jgi:hypothetical protein
MSQLENPRTVEALIDACERHDAGDDVEIILGHAALLDMARRLVALEKERTR